MFFGDDLNEYGEEDQMSDMELQHQMDQEGNIMARENQIDNRKPTSVEPMLDENNH